MAASGWAGDRHPCVLDHLPDGQVSWTTAGVVTLYQGDAAIRDIEVGSPIPAQAVVSCKGTQLELFNQTARATLAFQQVQFDLADLLATLAPPDPVAIAIESAQAAVRSGDVTTALRRIANLDTADPRLEPLWDPLRAAVPTDDPAAAVLALDALRLARPPARMALGISGARAQALLTLGRASEAEREATLGLTEADDGALYALRADARWALGDKSAAREDYAAAASRLAADAWPSTLRERCKGCAP